MAAFSDIEGIPFALLTDTLIILPTPIAINIQAYRTMYASLHANPTFCEMGFGPAFGVKSWSDEETRDVVIPREINKCWKVRGMGDFAVGLRGKADFEERPQTSTGRQLTSDTRSWIIEGSEFEQGFGKGIEAFEGVQWVGYAGVRDGTTTSIPPRTADDAPFPPWQEMIEVRYGVVPECWGQGIARKAQEVVMDWAVKERGVKKFIAETERANQRSGRVLEKMGFVPSGTTYWKEPEEMEWVKEC